jgi:hypothetical protein
MISFQAVVEEADSQEACMTAAELVVVVHSVVDLCLP